MSVHNVPNVPSMPLTGIKFYLERAVYDTEWSKTLMCIFSLGATLHLWFTEFTIRRH
jgi:hypothetical protein